MPNETDPKWRQAGWATYGAIMLFSGGLVGIVNGVWALRYPDRQADLVLAEKNLDAWGSFSLLAGAAMLGVAIAMFNGRPWSRWAGIALGVVGILWSAGWAEIQPMQSLISALVHISVVYALATHPVTFDQPLEPAEPR